MSQNIEHIEAKLCAYIDGMLDEHEAAEIERHLAANPGHQQLIEELRQTRMLLVSLPREKAPQDIADGLQTQLERSVLLSDAATPEETGVIGRIHRWPQYLSAAAVLLLAVGLAFVIYSMLPKDTAPHVAIQKTQTPTSDGGSPSAHTPANETKTPVADPAKEAEKYLAKKDLGDKGWSADRSGTREGEFNVPAAKLGAASEFKSGSLEIFGMLPTWHEAMDMATDNQTGRGVIVVVTDDLDQLQSRLATYFASNNIDYTATEAGVRDAEFAREALSLNHSLSLAGSPTAGDGVAPEDLDRKELVRYGGSQPRAGMERVPEERNPDSKDVPIASKAPATSKTDPMVNVTSMQPSTTSPAVARPSPVATAGEPGSKSRVNDGVPEVDQAAGGARLRQQLDRGYADAGRRSVIVARNLDPAQVEALTAKLNAEKNAHVMAMRRDALKSNYQQAAGDLAKAEESQNKQSLPNRGGELPRSAPGGPQAEDKLEKSSAGKLAHSPEGNGQVAGQELPRHKGGEGGGGGATTQPAEKEQTIDSAGSKAASDSYVDRDGKRLEDATGESADYIIVLEAPRLPAAPTPPATQPAQTVAEREADRILPTQPSTRPDAIFDLRDSEK